MGVADAEWRMVPVVKMLKPQTVAQQWVATQGGERRHHIICYDADVIIIYTFGMAA